MESKLQQNFKLLLQIIIVYVGLNEGKSQGNALHFGKLKFTGYVHGNYCCCCFTPHAFKIDENICQRENEPSGY